jgi:hypothetical protein
LSSITVNTGTVHVLTAANPNRDSNSANQLQNSLTTVNNDTFTDTFPLLLIIVLTYQQMVVFLLLANRVAGCSSYVGKPPTTTLAHVNLGGANVSGGLTTGLIHYSQSFYRTTESIDENRGIKR